MFRQGLAGVVNNLGNVFISTNRPTEAAFGEALTISKQLIIEVPDNLILRRALAMTHNSLGWLFQNTNRWPEAESSYSEALALYQQLDPEKNFPTRPEIRLEMATCHRNLSSVFVKTNRLEEARTEHAKALKILKQLATEFPSRPEFQKEMTEAEAQKP